MAQKTEDIIRDNLADRLSLFPEKLLLVDKNYHIQKTPFAGNRYIDILCTKEDKYIIIELKRSNQAARQTLNEVCKYVEGIMTQNGVKKSEIEVYIVSTEWSELLIPFSVFVKEVEFTVKGYNLTVIDNIPTEIEEVVPIEISEGRLFSKFQELLMFIDYATLKNNINPYIESYKKVGINDFVLIIFDIPQEYNVVARQQFSESMRQVHNSLGLDDNDRSNDLEMTIPDYSYAFYGGFRSCSIEYYESLLRENVDLWEEIQEIQNDYDKFELYEDNVINNLCDTIECDHLEIGYPAKLSQLLADGWSVKEIVRSGCFEGNHILSDDMIISELCGDRGTGGICYNRKGDLRDKSTISELKSDLIKRIDGDRTWINHINFIISQYETIDNRNLLFDLNFLMPNNFLMSIYHQLKYGGFGEDIPLYIPHYCFKVDEFKEGVFVCSKVYVGYIDYNGSVSSFGNILDKFYGGDIFQFSFPLIWGGFIENDHDIMEHLGLSYKTCMYTVSDDKAKANCAYKLDNFKFVKMNNKFSLFSNIFHFLDKNIELISNLMRSMNKIHTGGIIHQCNSGIEAEDSFDLES